MVKLEKFYDIQDTFKNLTNYKTNSCCMNYQTVNLGTEQKAQNINLGSGHTPKEREVFINLFKEYKDVFAWTYDDLKKIDTNIMQHNIPMKPYVKLTNKILGRCIPTLNHLLRKN